MRWSRKPKPTQLSQPPIDMSLGPVQYVYPEYTSIQKRCPDCNRMMFYFVVGNQACAFCDMHEQYVYVSLNPDEATQIVADAKLAKGITLPFFGSGGFGIPHPGTR